MLRETFQEFLIWMSKTDPDPTFSNMDKDPTFLRYGSATLGTTRMTP